MVGITLVRQKTPIPKLHVWDWDQLRMVKLKGTAKIFPPGEGTRFKFWPDSPTPYRRKFAQLPLTIMGSLLESPQSRTKMTLSVSHSFPFSSVPSLADCHIIQYSKRRELDRLGPAVDLSSYENEFGNRR